jgi:hypothetical protein
MLSATLAVATVCAVSLIPASADVAGVYGNSSSTTTTTVDGVETTTANKQTTLPIKATYGITKQSSTDPSGLLPQAKFIYTLSPDKTVSANTLTDDGSSMVVYSGDKLLDGDLTAEWDIASRYMEFDSTKSMSTTLSSATDVDGGLSIDLSQLFDKVYENDENGKPKLVDNKDEDGNTIVKSIKSGVYRFTLKESLFTDNYYKDNIAGSYDTEKTYRVDLYVQGSTKAVEATETTEAVPASSAYVYMVKVYQWVDEVKQDDGTVVAAHWGKADPEFKNTIEVEDLIIKNYVDNNVTSDDVSFKIALQILEGSDEDRGVTLSKDTDLHAYINRLQEDGTYKKETAVIKVNSNDPKSDNYVNYVELFNGDELVVPGVPVYMKYTTYNADAGNIDKADYTKKVDAKIGYEDEEKKIEWSEPEKAAHSTFGTAVTTTADNEETYLEMYKRIEFGQNMIIYYNVNTAVAATGIAMESAPYVVMFLAAAAIAVLAVAKKKTNR